MSLLIGTEDLQKRHRAMVPLEKLRQQHRDYAMYHLGQGAFMEDPITNPTNAIRQMGKPMSSDALEKLLTKISPNFKFFPAHDYVVNNSPLVPNGTRFRMKSLWYVGGAEAIPITNYHADSMPEWSLWDYRVERIPDPSFQHANRFDYPKMEWGGWDKGFVADPNDDMPGYLKIKKAWHEIRRGWRTVLVYVVRYNLFSPTYMEQFIPGGDRASWQVHFKGNKNLQVPF